MKRRIGRNVQQATLKPRAGHKGQFIFTLDGDRGTIRLYLTEEEVRYLFNKQSIDGLPDALGFTFHLEPGKVRELWEGSGLHERRRDAGERIFAPLYGHLPAAFGSNDWRSDIERSGA